MPKKAAAIALARSLMGDREIRVVATRIRKLHRPHLTKLLCTASCIEGVPAYRAGPSLQQLQIRCIELAQQVGAVPFTRLLTDVEELPPHALGPPKWRKKDAIEYHIAGLKTMSTIPTQALDSETLPAFSRTLSSYRHKVEDVHTIVHAGIKRVGRDEDTIRITTPRNLNFFFF